MKDENFKKMKNHNILSHKEIRELTLFFTKQIPIKLFERLDGIKKHIEKLEYSSYLEDIKTLETLKKYVRSKIIMDTPLKECRRKTILKIVIVVCQKMAMNRKLSVNQCRKNTLHTNIE
jgi:hypothetical protein